MASKPDVMSSSGVMYPCGSKKKFPGLREHSATIYIYIYIYIYICTLTDIGIDIYA